MNTNIHRSARRIAVWPALLVVAALGAAGCSGSRAVPDRIAVVGDVSSRGQEPFTVQMLETDQQNLYILVLDEGQRRSYVTPARVHVTGIVYVDEWAGRPYTHLRVERIEPAP